MIAFTCNCLQGFFHRVQSSFSLGARGFSCAVSGFGQVLKSDPPLSEHMSACGRRNEAPRYTREKTSGTQGKVLLPSMVDFDQFRFLGNCRPTPPLSLH